MSPASMAASRPATAADYARFPPPAQGGATGGQLDSPENVTERADLPTAPTSKAPTSKQTPTSERLWVSEIFVSRQGEGSLTGTDSLFIRLSGCNLRCWFCDTPYASWSPEGSWYSLAQLLRQADQSGVRHVVLTGGEPLLPAAVVPLVAALRQRHLHVTIETAGSVFRPLAIDLVSISPKLSGSGPLAAAASRGNAAEQSSGYLNRWQLQHEAARWRPQVIRRLIDQSLQHQIKFVIDTAADFQETRGAVQQLAVQPANVWIMPQGLTTEELDEKRSWLLPLCQREGYRYCDRMHIRWYGNRRGT